MGKSNTALILGGLFLGAVILSGGAAASVARDPEKRRALLATLKHGKAAVRVGTMQLRFMPWMKEALKQTEAHEGPPWATNCNWDNNGLSWGMIQWTQEGGGLGDVLLEITEKEPELVQSYLGVATYAILKNLNAPPEERSIHDKFITPDGQFMRLWEMPWADKNWAKKKDDAQIGLFNRLGAHARVRQLQLEVAANGPYMRSAIQIVKMLDLQTERGLTMAFNRAVHQGAQGALSIASTLAHHWNVENTKPAGQKERMAQYAWLCARGFRTETQPLSLQRSKTTTWKMVDDEYDLGPAGQLLVKTDMPSPVWHAFSGPADLWELIIKRSADIINNPKLADVPINVSDAIVG